MLYQFYVGNLLSNDDTEQASGLFFAPSKKEAAAYVTVHLRGLYAFSDTSTVYVWPIPEYRGQCRLIHRWEAGPRDKSAAFHMDDLISHW